jgi:hypothetical protein
MEGKLMNKAKLIGLGVLVVLGAAVGLLWLSRWRQPVAPPVPAVTAQEAVAKVLAPRKAPAEPVAVSSLAVELVPAPEPAVEPSPGEGVGEATVAGPMVKVGAKQVLAVVNGIPLTGAQVMPPGRFKGGDSMALSPEVLEEVLERSIQRELILQAAVAQGVALDERNLKQLEEMYLHLTGNPLNLKGGWTLGDMDVQGDVQDALFHLRDKASRLLQLELLRKAGTADTAEARQALREQLRSAATIEKAGTAAPAQPASS